MVRISDIFKRQAAGSQQHLPETKPKEEPLKENPGLEKNGLASNSHPAVGGANSQSHSEGLKPPDTSIHKVIAQKEQAETQGHKQGSVSMPMDKTAIDIARSKNLYLMGIQLIREIFLNTEQLKSINLVQIEQWVSDITNHSISRDTELLDLFYEYASENYLYDHMVNTTIMSIELGLGLDYNESQLKELGLATFLHDIGMIKVDKLAMDERKLSEEEYNQIKEHSLYGVEILSKIKDIPEPVIYAAREAHERQDGSGYPNGLKNGEITEYGKIIAIVDVYEALTHNRPYRKKFSPHNAVKELIAKESIFDSQMLKVLINKIGVYPVSSWVELNSNEIGKVVMNNEEFPLRPSLKIFFDVKRIPLKAPRLVNLSEQFNLFIKKAIADDDLVRDVKGRVKF